MSIVKSLRLFAIGVLICLVWFSVSVFSQTSSPPPGTPLRIAQPSKKAVHVQGPVTFEQVLADPNNPDLNFLYAKTQIKKGDLIGASSSLQRVLLINPNHGQVRLLYAVVLYRLDNLHEAEVEFKSLRELRISDSLRREIDGFLDQIRVRKRKTHISFRQSVAFQYDSNRNAAPSSKERFFADVRFPLSRQSGRQSDTGFLNITNVEISQDLGFQAGHQLIGSFSFFVTEQTEQDSLDLSQYRQEYGAAIKTPFFNVTPTVFVENVLLSRETFQRSQGGNLSLDRSFFNRLNVYAVGRLARQEYLDITENLAAHEREGDRMDATVGFQYALFNPLRFSAKYTRSDKNAKEEYNASTSNVFGLGATVLPGKGQFLSTLLDFGFDRYEAPDFAIASRHRRDKNLQVRLTYGAPLKFFFLSKNPIHFLDNIMLTVVYEYDRSLSNLTNYTYKNNKFQTMMSKKVEF